jgi:hypothetical protein
MNPFNWIIQKELVTIHEFIADEAAVGNSNVEAFAKMLLQTHYGNHFLNPTHQFFYSSIKRRLTMLTKSTNTKYSYLRRVLVLPILIASVCLVSIKVNASEKIGKKIEEIKNDFSLLVSDTTKPTKKSSVKSLPAPPAPPAPPTPPTPPTPPAPPKVNKTDSKGNNFIVTSKYTVATAVLSVDTAVLVSDANYEGIQDKKTISNAIKPAFYLDGVKITEKEMRAISPNDIESINVLKGEYDTPQSLDRFCT